MTADLMPVDQLGPGLVPAGFAEQMLDRAGQIGDARTLYDGAAYLSGLAQKWNGHGAEKREIKAAQMFCEIRLGQLLGPNPGDQGKGPGKSPHADFDLPKSRVQEFRRYFGHLDLLTDAVRNGALSRRSLLLLVDKHEADLRPTPVASDLDIVAGDFRSELATLDPGSVALVLTDPPYPTEYLPLWSDLGKHASVWLPEGGSLVAYCGQSILPQALDRLCEHLRYWWTLALLHQHATAMIPGKWVSAGWKPLLWFVNGHRGGRTMLADRIAGSPPRKTIPTGDGGDWAQGVTELEPIISALTNPGDLIVDPFAGSGSVGLAATRFGRRFIGAELNA